MQPVAPKRRGRPPKQRPVSADAPAMAEEEMVAAKLEQADKALAKLAEERDALKASVADLESQVATLVDENSRLIQTHAHEVAREVMEQQGPALSGEAARFVPELGYELPASPKLPPSEGSVEIEVVAKSVYPRRCWIVGQPDDKTDTVKRVAGDRVLLKSGDYVAALNAGKECVRVL